MMVNHPSTGIATCGCTRYGLTYFYFPPVLKVGQVRVSPGDIAGRERLNFARD